MLVIYRNVSFFCINVIEMLEMLKKKFVIEMLEMLVLDMVDVFLVYYIFSYKI